VDAGDGRFDVVERRVRFDDLPAVVRSRFVACAAGSAEPRPLAVALRSSRVSLLVAIALSAAAVLLGMLMFGVGLEQGGWEVVTAIYGVAVLFVLAPALAALAERAQRRALPWAPGRYLFPACIVDATRPELRVRSLASLERARIVGLRHPRLELMFDGAKEVFAQDRFEPLDPKEIRRLATRVSKLVERDNSGELARFDPLLPGDVEGTVELMKGYRSRTERVVVDAPLTDATPWWSRHAVLAALALSAFAATALGGLLLPSLALNKARAKHEPAALRRVAAMWPFEWVAREAGVVRKDARLAFADLSPRLGAPEGDAGRALRELLERAQASGEPRVPTFVSLTRPTAPDLARVTLPPVGGRNIAVALQRALALPEELFEVSYAGSEPPEGDHAEVRCSLETTGKNHVVGGLRISGIVLRCEAWLVHANRSTRIAVGVSKPSETIDLAAVLAEPPPSDDATDDPTEKSTPRPALDELADTILVKRAIEGMPLAFEHGLADEKP
jgi:hypothetical protein